MNTQKDLQQIIERYISGKATAEEIKFVEKYYQYLDKGEDVLGKDNMGERMQMEEENLQAILSAIHHPKNTPKHVVVKYAIAASLVFVLGFGVLYFTKNQSLKDTQKIANAPKINDVLPGKNRAVLTLADGSKIILDDLKEGKISETENLVITKTKDGQLIYKANNINTKTNLVAYNTIETPRGGQYQIFLPDGTKVWLNASSSLKYPERFTSNQRRVTLTGEAYFEVAKDKVHPFIVRTESTSDGQAGQEVEVLGTHFNINGYRDEQTIKTTLVEGSVKVSSLSTQNTNILSPGQQSIIGNNSFIIRNVETGDETAWKDNVFIFNNSSLTNILYQLERWYDIKIDYENIPNKRYRGMVSRKAKLSEVLHMLELTGNIDFKIDEGRQLKVLTK